MIPSLRSRSTLFGIIAALGINAIGPVNTAMAVDTDAEARSVLTAHCQSCHGPSKQKSGLRLDSRDGALGKGDSGSPAIIPGKAAASEVMRRVTVKDPADRMPPDGAGLTAAQIDTLRKWIDAGAAWPQDGNGPANLAKTELVVTDEDRQHWAFKPLQKVEVPSATADRGRTPIDRFIRIALAAKKLTAAPPAAPRALIRRVTFDVTGLPPTPNDVEAFVGAKDPNAAYEALVDRLLASRHYGERWGRHWLDVARYADSNGYESDIDRPNAYYYRDFVITALNADMPFDEFIRWQLAGDEIAPSNPQAIAATGFLAAGPSESLPDNLLEEERKRQRYNDLDDIVSTTGAALLGLTVGCARCHDHKFDPIPTRDYYRLLAGFHSGNRADVPLGALKKDGPKALPRAFAFKDMGPKPAASWLFRRGDFHDRTIPVELGFLTVLTRGKPAADYWKEARARAGRTDTTYQRRALAAWVADADRGAGPLLARVIANRVWQHHFGEGLVRTPNDFGARGDRPTHPELLEWLAADLVAHGWKLKRMHRMILLSATYRQGNTFDPEKAKADPDNRLLWRMRPRRLEAEVLRDALLAVGGTLNTEMYGPAFKPPIPPDAIVARNIKSPYPTNIPDTSAVRRRSVYLFHKRVIPYPLLQAFDAPDAQQCNGRRSNTTVVPQALALLNDPFVRARAADFSARLLKESGEDPVSCVESAYRLAFSRAPTRDEKVAGVEFLAAQQRERSSRQAKTAAAEIRQMALIDYCQVLFGLNEFIYVD
jgi:mono/diheme cytochrome c family protein